jgi:hypothetical protein
MISSVNRKTGIKSVSQLGNQHAQPLRLIWDLNIPFDNLRFSRSAGGLRILGCLTPKAFGGVPKIYRRQTLKNGPEGKVIVGAAFFGYFLGSARK